MQTASNEKIMKLILTGLMMAMITVATMVIQIPVPFTSGYIHLGDSMIFISVLVLGWKYGAVAAGVGSAMADLLSGYVHWVPWTLCIKGLMALLMGLAIEQCINSKKKTAVLALLTAGAWIVFQLIVRFTINVAASTNPEVLFSDEAATLSELGVFISNIQNQLLLMTLLIPVLLAAAALYVRKKENFVIPVHQILGMTIAGLWMVFGYYLAGGVLSGNFAVSAFSIPANMIQFVLGFFIAALIAAALLKTPAARYFAYGKAVLADHYTV